LFDGKRLDLWLKYGFIGPIMLELKLLHNPEITDTAKRKAYKIKLKQYIKACEAEYAYYVVFNIKKNNPSHITAFKSLENEYADIPNLKIVLIECPVK
jgi:hypothetical protein